MTIIFQYAPMKPDILNPSVMQPNFFTNLLLSSIPSRLYFIIIRVIITKLISKTARIMIEKMLDIVLPSIVSNLSPYILIAHAIKTGANYYNINLRVKFHSIIPLNQREKREILYYYLKKLMNTLTCLFCFLIQIPL
jgi:hypothetical protein